MAGLWWEAVSRTPIGTPVLVLSSPTNTMQLRGNSPSLFSLPVISSLQRVKINTGHFCLDECATLLQSFSPIVQSRTYFLLTHFSPLSTIFPYTSLFRPLRLTAGFGC